MSSAGARMDCPRCSTNVREHERHCPACYHDVGFPNVRVAQKPEERAALGRRYKSAEASAAVRGCSAVLAEFCTAVRSSQGVICRPLSIVLGLLSSDSSLYASFYSLTAAGARRPEDTEADRLRLQADDLLFPHYREQIRFAALSLNGRGVASFGEYSLVLKDVAIRERATVFEENSVEFFRKRDFTFGSAVPPGYRAPWDQRERLAVAKLGTALRDDTRSQEFPELLLRPSPVPFQEDFVEVHIYGPLHCQSVERVLGPTPKRKADRILLKQLEDLLSGLGTGGTT